jgi:hypothetical protein
LSWASSSSVFLFGFWSRVSITMSGLDSDSTSQVTGITSLHHHTWLITCGLTNLTNSSKQNTFGPKLLLLLSQVLGHSSASQRPHMSQHVRFLPA